ncbi:MAG: hypothetical protein ACJ8C4_14585 [Gemmataceae bacterium]
MSRRKKLLLILVLVSVCLVVVLLVVAQIGPSIEIAKNVKGGMDREQVVQILGPPVREDKIMREWRRLRWDLKDGTFEVRVNSNGQIISLESDNTPLLSPDAPGAPNAKTLADVANFRNSTTREEVLNILGPPNHERDEKYENRRMSWELKDGVVTIAFDRKDRVFSDGVRAHEVSQWSRLWPRVQATIRHCLKSVGLD